MTKSSQKISTSEKGKYFQEKYPIYTTEIQIILWILSAITSLIIKTTKYYNMWCIF